MSANFPAPRDLARDPEHPLARAFASFTEAAGSLERTYGQLQGQVAHLRKELEVTNRDLAKSLEENHRIRERLRRILEGLPCGVLVVEGGSQIAIVNPEAARLAGGSFESVDSLPAGLSAALDRARGTGEECEWSLAGSLAARPVWVAIRHAWLERNETHATSVFILRDVSEAKKLEQDREHLRRQQALVEMSALLAHEIRNPLGSLELFAGLLAESRLEGESRRWIEHVQAGLRTLSSTVNNVLAPAQQPPPSSRSIDGPDCSTGRTIFCCRSRTRRGSKSRLSMGSLASSFQADRHLLEQVLLNLALNAFRFMPGGGWLAIRGSAGGGSDHSKAGVEIEVRDTGPGIVPDDLPRIFEAGFSTRPGSERTRAGRLPPHSRAARRDRSRPKAIPVMERRSGCGCRATRDGGRDALAKLSSGEHRRDQCRACGEARP